MAKVSLSLDNRRQKPSVKLLINVGSRNSLISLGVALDSPEQWSPDNPKGPVILHPSSRSINALLRARLAMAQEVLHSMMMAQEEITLDSLKSAIVARMDPERAERTQPKDTLLEWWRRFEAKKEGRTRELYHETQRRIADFAVYHATSVDPRDDRAIHNNPRALQRGEAYLLSLTLQEVTPSWISDLDTYLSRSMGVNTRAIHLRNLRAVIKDAIKNDAEVKDPFLKFDIRREDTRHRALTPEQFKTLFTYPIPKQEKELHEYRDVALLIFCLIGINVVDLYDATAITNGRLEYDRRKTHRHYSIKIEPEAAAILKKYRGKHHLLRYADNNKSHMSLTKKLDRSLKRIGPVTYIPSNTRNHQPFKRWNGLFPQISVYWLRHTWATFAAKLGVPKDTIALCLGHGKKTVTDIYIDYDQSIIDDANRKVINYINLLLK